MVCQNRGRRQVTIWILIGSTCLGIFGLRFWKEDRPSTAKKPLSLRQNVPHSKETSSDFSNKGNSDTYDNNNNARDAVSQNGPVKVYNNNNMTATPSCPEVRHVAFVKVHKAGSTTVMNILERFAFMRSLLLALPKQANILYPGFSNLVRRPKHSTFDMLITHVDHYDRALFASVLPADAKYIGIIREPLKLTISAFEYYHRIHGLYRNVPGNDTLREYLHHRAMYEPKQASASYTNNRMSYDFGLPQSLFHNEEAVRKFLLQLDSEMDLVLVVEKFSESLVLLKRMMCWQLKDVLYITRNKNRMKGSVDFSADELKYHRNFSFADNMLYDYFTNRLNEKIQAQGNDFQKEVDVLNSMLQKVSIFCHEVSNNNWNRTKSLVFSKTNFNEVFEVDIKDCRLMMLEELAFVDLSRLKNLETEILALGKLPPGLR